MCGFGNARYQGHILTQTWVTWKADGVDDLREANPVQNS